MTQTPLAAIVLAAGLGTRMRSETPKHLHPLLGRRLADWVVEAARGLGPDPLVIVISPDARDAFPGETVAVQERPRGQSPPGLQVGIASDASALGYARTLGQRSLAAVGKQE